MRRNEQLSVVHHAARRGYWDVVEYVINTFKTDDSRELDYEGVVDWIFFNLKNKYIPLKEADVSRNLLIAKEILINNPHIALKLKCSDPALYLNANTRSILSNTLSKQMGLFITQGVGILFFLNNFKDANNAPVRDLIPAIIRYALIDLIYRIHCESDLLSVRIDFDSENNRIKGYSSIDHSGIAEIITPYLVSREYDEEYKANAKKLVDSQGGGIFGCLGKSADTTIFINRLRSMLQFRAGDNHNYIHDFVKNRYSKGSCSEKNIIPALVMHKLITQKEVNAIKEEAMKPMMDDWTDLGQTATLL